MNKLDNLVFDLFSYSECLKIKLNIVILINVCMGIIILVF